MRCSGVRVRIVRRESAGDRPMEFVRAFQRNDPLRYERYVPLWSYVNV